MSVTAAQIDQVRRWTAESTTATYTDDAIIAAIEARPVPDKRGVAPFVWDYTTTPPSQTTNTNWIETYNLNQVAADIWEEKAAAVACDYAFSADGASYSRNQKFEQYMRMAQKFRARGTLGVIELASRERQLTPQNTVIERVQILDRETNEEDLSN